MRTFADDVADPPAGLCEALVRWALEGWGAWGASPIEEALKHFLILAGGVSCDC